MSATRTDTPKDPVQVGFTFLIRRRDRMSPIAALAIECCAYPRNASVDSPQSELPRASVDRDAEESPSSRFKARNGITKDPH